MDLKPQWEESKSRRTQDEALEDISNTYAEMVQMRARKYNRSYTMLQQQLHSDIIQFEFIASACKYLSQFLYSSKK